MANQDGEPDRGRQGAKPACIRRPTRRCVRTLNGTVSAGTFDVAIRGYAAADTRPPYGMTTMDLTGSIADMLGRTALFGLLREDDRKLVAERMRRIQFEPRQLIFSRGDPGRDVYLVLEGRVRLSILSSDGRELSFAHAAPGNVFGEIATLDGGERTAGATAISAVKAMALGQKPLLDLIEVNPRVAQATIRFLCSRLRDTDLKLEAIALHDIDVRLARFFLSLLKAGAKPDKDGQTPLEIGMSQGELALLIGASRPKVNIAMTKLEDRGAISRSGKGYVCDATMLEDLAGAD